MEQQTVFKTHDLKKSYGKTLAIDKVSLDVSRGQIYGILGPNGSGKTTTLSIAMGILSQDQGEFNWFEESPSPSSRKRIGSLIEVPHFYPYLSLSQNLRLISRIKGYGEDDIERVLKLVRLYDRRSSKFKTMSLGMKQRLGLAAAMLGDPEVLVLDEPTNGLDPEGIAEVRTLIKEEGERGKTIIMASHILSEVEKVCSHVAILKNGKLLEQGSVKTIISGESSFEVDAEDRKNLKKLLDNSDFVESITESETGLNLVLTEGKKAEDLNRYAFENGIVLTHLIIINKSLESQFLELVKEK